MQVFEVSVTRSRTVKPKDYESTGSSITMKAMFNEDENHALGLLNLVNEARDLVFRDLGLNVPTPLLYIDLGSAVIEEVTVQEEPTEPVQKATKKTTKKATKKTTKKKDVDPVDDIPDDDDDETPSTDSVPEGDIETPEESEESEESEHILTTEELQQYIVGVRSKNLIPTNSIKEILSSHGASRVSQVPVDKTNVVRDTIQQVIDKD